MQESGKGTEAQSNKEQMTFLYKKGWNYEKIY